MAFRMAHIEIRSRCEMGGLGLFSSEDPLFGRLNREQVYAGRLICEVHLQVRKPPNPAAFLRDCMDSTPAAWARYRNDQIRLSAATAHVQFPGNEPVCFDRLSDLLANLGVRCGLCDRLLVDIAMPERRSNDGH